MMTSGGELDAGDRTGEKQGIVKLGNKRQLWSTQALEFIDF